MEPYLAVLIAHGVIGGADVLFNHELIARVPALPHARAEQWLHSARELTFAAIFLALAWWAWHGLAALVIAALLLAELAISTIDTVLEFDIRTLPVSERIAHVLLFVNFGLVLALTGEVLLAWGQLPTALVVADHGLASWLLTALAIGALGWSGRDALAARRLKTAAAAGMAAAAGAHQNA